MFVITHITEGLTTLSVQLMQLNQSRLHVTEWFCIWTGVDRQLITSNFESSFSTSEIAMAGRKLRISPGYLWSFSDLSMFLTLVMFCRIRLYA